MNTVETFCVLSKNPNWFNKFNEDLHASHTQEERLFHINRCILNNILSFQSLSISKKGSIQLIKNLKQKLHMFNCQPERRNKYYYKLSQIPIVTILLCSLRDTQNCTLSQEKSFDKYFDFFLTWMKNLKIDFKQVQYIIQQTIRVLEGNLKYSKFNQQTHLSSFQNQSTLIVRNNIDSYENSFLNSKIKSTLSVQNLKQSYQKEQKKCPKKKLGVCDLDISESGKKFKKSTQRIQSQKVYKIKQSKGPQKPQSKKVHKFERDSTKKEKKFC